MVLRFGEFALDEERRQLTRAGTSIHLTPKAFDLLLFLASKAPRVVSKAELHERLWPGTFVSDATLVGVVKEVRRALNDRDANAPILRTIHRVGYAFCPKPDGIEPAALPRVWHWLVVRGRRFALAEGENVIGRDPNSQVWLDESGVSRRHARVVIDRDGAKLEDLGSKNGTMVGGAPLQRVVVLRDGDRITFGSIVSVYRTSGAGMSTETQSRRRSRIPADQS